MAKLILTNSFLCFSSQSTGFPFVLPWDDLLPSSKTIFNHFNTKDFQISISNQDFSPLLKVCTFNLYGLLAFPCILPKLDSLFFSETFILPLFSILVSCIPLHVIPCPWASHTILDFSPVTRSCLYCSRALLNSFLDSSPNFLKSRGLLNYQYILFSY